MTSDLNKNIARIDYNCLNLPTMIRFGDGSKYMSMKYDAAGRLLRRTTRVPFRDIAVSGKLQQELARVDLTTLSSGIVARNVAAASATSTAGSSSACSSAPSTSLLASSSGASAPAISGKAVKRAFGVTDYDYCGNVEYINDKAVLYHSEGYVTFDKNQQPEFHYYLKDHLGNIRMVFNERDSVEQVTHYYPFGGSFADGVGSSVQDYLYSGKELTRFNALNWYNYGARWYDPTTLRWNGVDKLAEKYTPVSPYTFCLDNPVRYIDPDGNEVHVEDSCAYMALLNTILLEDRTFVSLDKDGNVDLSLMRSHKSNSINYSILLSLSSSDITYNLSTNINYSYMDNEGNLLESALTYFEPDAEFADVEIVSPSGLTTGETGKYGITLLPGKGKSGVNSKDGSAYIYIHPTLTETGKAEAVSHELYGHAYLYDIHRDRDIAGHDYRNTMKEHNLKLRECIIRARKETVSNLK